ncbi:Hsp70 family protein [Nocardia sp. NPDC058705]|uniref:Hsp70 family protein n=1 Tax=Nocardia sp. NPDC058705 TaxID=3346609 RepID=UPI00368B4495
MTDRLALGLTVGASRSVAVATAADGGAPVAVIQRSTAVEVATTAGPAVVVEGFLSRVGDPVRMLAQDGSSHVAADLVAAATTRLIADICDADAAVVSCHPGWWPDVRVQAVRAALDNAGAGSVVLVPEPLAVVRRYEIERGLLDEGALVVYDLGDSGLTVSVVRTGEKSGLLGVAAHSSDIAGSEFDLLTMRYVLGHALGDNEIDPFEPAVETELAALRERCRIAKEALSLDTAAVVSVGALAADGTGQVRIVRNELEDLLRSDVRDSLELVREAVQRAGIGLADVAAVLLTGGGGAIPLVAELISAEFGLPVVACEDPATASAAGAAELAADLLAAESAGAQPLLVDGMLAADAASAAAAAGFATAEPESDHSTIEFETTEPAGKHAAAEPTGKHAADRTDVTLEKPSELATAEPFNDITPLADIDNDEPTPQILTKKRLAVVAAAVAVFGALTAGTLAVAPQFATPSTPETTTNGTPIANIDSPVSVAVTPPLDANGKPVLGTPTLDATGKPIPGAPTLDPTGKPIPGTTVDATGNPVVGAPTVDATGQPIAPGTQNAAPQGQQQQVQSVGSAPAQGAPAQAPAPQRQQAPAPQQQQAPAPAPQQQPAPQQPAPQQPAPQPAPQQPAPQPAPAPNIPNVGAVPGQVLDGAGEVVEGTVGGVTKLPGGLLGGGN